MVLLRVFMLEHTAKAVGSLVKEPEQRRAVTGSESLQAAHKNTLE